MVEQGHFRELQSILRLLENEQLMDSSNASGAAPVGDGEGNGNDSHDESHGGDSGTDPTSARRQTFLFSATLMLPPKAREANAKRLSQRKATPKDSTMDKLLRMIEFRNQMKVVDLSRPELVARGVEQSQLSCTRDEKDAFLFLLLRTRFANGRTIIFTNAITALQRLRSLLAMLGVDTLSLQGSMQQRARLKALDRFKAQPGCVLLATDVAARGLDIDGVDFVVHYQLPRSAEVYIHRSGRTARAAASGLSVALIEPSDVKAHQRLCRELDKTDGLPELPIESRQIPRVREIVSLGRQLERAAHIESRKASNATWRKQLAKDMDLPSDSDEDDGGEQDHVSRGQERKREAEKERLRAKLKMLIGKLERPTGSIQELALTGVA